MNKPIKWEEGECAYAGQAKGKPINKRWPGRWSIKATICTPKGTRIDIETDLEDAAGESIMAKLGEAVSSPEHPPEWMRTGPGRGKKP